MKTSKYILPILCLLAVACREVPSYDMVASKGDTLKENMINANRIISQSEEQQIDAYLTRRGWQLERLTGGVRASEMGNSDTHLGTKVEYEDTVDVVYSVLTLGGDTIYGRREERLVAGHLQPTRGFDIALRTLHEGAQALIIVPSEQAYGLMGDGDRIRTRTVLVYDMSVLKIRKLK